MFINTKRVSKAHDAEKGLLNVMEHSLIKSRAINNSESWNGMSKTVWIILIKRARFTCFKRPQRKAGASHENEHTEQ